MTQLSDKLKRAATEGGRELSDGVLLACGWTKRRVSDEGYASWRWQMPKGGIGFSEGYQPDPTRNLQDAVSLVPEGMEFSFTNLYGVARVEMGLNVSEFGPWYASRTDGDICLAFCEAILKAHESSKAEAA